MSVTFASDVDQPWLVNCPSSLFQWLTLTLHVYLPLSLLLLLFKCILWALVGVSCDDWRVIVCRLERRAWARAEWEEGSCRASRASGSVTTSTDRATTGASYPGMSSILTAYSHSLTACSCTMISLRSDTTLLRYSIMLPKHVTVNTSSMFKIYVVSVVVASGHNVQTNYLIFMKIVVTY